MISILKPKKIGTHNQKWPGFTLIELVVVITILAILGTIAFLSSSGYSSRARDSERVANVVSLTKTLDLSTLTTGTYPTPDNSFAVTFSGGLVWNQGTAGSGVMTQLHQSVSGGGLNQKPVDPLKKTEYAYSTLAFGKAYQIKTEYEGDLTSSTLDIDIWNTAHAAPGAPSIAYIRGNYGGLAAKTQSGSTTCVLAVPSIITNTGAIGSTVEITAGTLSGTLLFHGKNLSKASNFNPNVAVFCGTSLPTNDSGGQITTMMNNLKTAYSGSDIASSVSSVSALLATTNTEALSTLGTSVITSQLGGTSAPSSGPVWICNNSVVNGCTTGSPINQSAGSCGGTATWNCSTAGGNSIQCSKANAACAVNCSYTTYQWGSCSVSCGGGNYAVYYTKTVPESGGGTCSISEGQLVGYTWSACNTQACVTYSWVFSNDYGNTYVGGSNPWSMTNYGSCGTCSSGNVGSYCSMNWNQYWPSDPDCPNMWCGMRHVCQ